MTPIEQVHVSQLGAPGRTLLLASDAGVPALGYVVEYAALNATLAEHARAAGVPWLDGADARQVEASSDGVRLRYLRSEREATLAALLRRACRRQR